MSEIRQFFDAYSASFEQGPAAIAQMYHAPCITARMGVPTLNATRKDVEGFSEGAWTILLQTLHDS